MKNASVLQRVTESLVNLVVELPEVQLLDRVRPTYRLWREPNLRTQASDAGVKAQLLSGRRIIVLRPIRETKTAIFAPCCKRATTFGARYNSEFAICQAPKKRL